MTKATAIVLTGDKELDAALDALEPKLRRKIENKAIKQAAEPARDKIKALAPVDTGDYKKVIKVRAVRVSRRKKKHTIGASVMTVMRDLEQLHAEGRTNVFNPHWLEFGTKKTTAQPHFRPGAIQAGPQVIARMRERLGVLVRETANEVRRN